MTSQPIPTTSASFFAIAVREGMIAEDLANQLQEEAVANDATPSAICIERGALSPVQVDVIVGLSAPEDIAPGFEVLSLLGYGGLGVVYRAQQPKLDRVVALKTIQLSRLDSAGTIARFQQEAKLIGRLKHPNIVTAYDFGTHAERLFLAMELVEGSDLEDFIKASKQVPESVAWDIARQVAAGLAQAAEHAVVHRDIKPANLLLTKPPAGYPLPKGVPLVKITDFGLAQLTAEGEEQTRLTLAGTSMGTPHYMAPEQISDAHVDLRADIYALGATVFHMLSGEPPYAGQNVGRILSAKILDDPGLLAGLESRISATSLELLRDMLAHDPEDRISDYQELLSRLHPLTATKPTADWELKETVPSFPIPTPSPEEKPTTKKRSKIVLLAAVGVVALLLASPFLYSAFRPQRPDIGQYVKTGWEEPLFEGRSLDANDWKYREGVFQPGVDAEKAQVLKGKNGSIIRYLPPESLALGDFGISMNVMLSDADAVEVHFDHADVMDDESPRDVLRFTKEGATLGTLNSSDGHFRAMSDTCQWKPATNDLETPTYAELILERRGDYWVAFLDGEEVGYLRAQPLPEQAAIQLAVRDGEAEMVGLSIYGLTPDE